MALTTPEERSCALGHLIERRKLFGRLRRLEVESVATACGVSVPTVYRWLASGAPPAATGVRGRYSLTDEDLTAFFKSRGDVAAMHRLIVAERAENVPSLSTLRRAIRRDTDAALRAAARGGMKAKKSARMVLRHKPCARNERWEGDHTALEIQVLAPGFEKPVRPWLTWLIDVGTRAIMGWGLAAGAPNRGTVLAAIRSGVDRENADAPFYGVPGILLWDNGLEFTAGAVTEAAAMLGSVAVTTPPYSPERKPFIERVNRTLEVELISKLPHYVDGPRARDGSLEDPEDSMLSLEHLAHLLDQWIRHYNCERKHTSLKGRTPLEAWTSDPTPIREVSGEDTRLFTLERFDRKVRADGGIHVDNVAYIAPELFGLEKETVSVGQIPYDRSRIEVFYESKWICTAVPTETLSAEQTTRMRAAARAADEKLRRERRRLARDGRIRIGTITSDALDPRILPVDPRSKKDAQERRDIFGFGDEIGEVE